MNLSAPTRRDALKLLGVASVVGLETRDLAARQPNPSPLAAAVVRNTEAVRAMLTTQVTGSTSPFRGARPDATGLHHPSSAGGIIESLTAAFVHPDSPYRGTWSDVRARRVTWTC